MMKKTLLFLFITFINVFYNAQDGTLDTSFNTTGKFFLDTVFNYPYNNTEVIADIVEQPDGKLLILGKSNTSSGFFQPVFCKVFRLNTDGTLDTTFGNNGIFSYSTDAYVHNLFSNLNKLILQPDGTIFVIGYGKEYQTDIGKTTMIKLSSNGIMDTSFGNNGIGRYYGGGISGVLAYNGYYYLYGGSSNDALIIKMDTNGNIDYNFNGVGYLTQDIDNEINNFQKMIIKDNKLIAFGTKLNSNNQIYLTVCKFDLDGNQDFSYGNSGITSAFLYNEEYSSLNDMKLINGDKYLFSIRGNFYQLNKYGVLDSSFGINGVKTNPFNRRFDCVQFTEDGKIIMSKGLITGYFSNYMSVNTVKLNSDFNVDSNFGTNGESTINIFPNYHYEQYSYKIKQLNNGKILVGGSITITPNPNVPSIKNENYFILRYNNSVNTLKTNDLIADSNNFQIYPNPAYDIINIKTNKELKNIEIFDSSGKIVKTQERALKRIDISDLQTGMYILKAFDGKKSLSSMFLKKGSDKP
ncbi:T9SS type A sorting domain-containing protein [Chryseobacterium mucoviscidosis]|uniref:T9SS type A sorting domain-containing protein n=1 Tax=Chryseobacterium mucoviscidosis TaxID=1945581 RepID=UPI000EC2180F|nr:hypothetical protein [Chryseobacterium sp.]